MADNKRQHFVPKSTLRRFASDAATPQEPRQIHLVNIDSGKIIRNASLKTQCYRDYFYGRDLVVEKLLGPVEGEFVALTNKMIDTSSMEERAGWNLVRMIMLQRGRTLRADAESNEIINRMAKLLLYNRVPEQDLRNTRIGVTEGARLNVAYALRLSPLILDLKRFLIVNSTSVPFVIADNPVVSTNWFCRLNYPHQMAGLARSGLQLLMPLSPWAALMMHDSNVYSTTADENVIKIRQVEEIVALNELQWLNAFENLYLPPDLDNARLQTMMAVQRSSDALTGFTRMHAIGDNSFQASDRDEFAPPPEGMTRELVNVSAKSLPRDLRLRAVGIRRSPVVQDNGSVASPQRDQAWTGIVTEFAKALEAGAVNMSEFWDFTEAHPLAPKIGAWLRRAKRKSDLERERQP